MVAHALIQEDTVTGADAGFGPFVVVGADPVTEPEPTRFGDRVTVRSHTVIYRATIIGDDFQTGHGVLVREHTRIGDRVSIGSHTVVEHHVQLGDGVRLHSNCFVPEYSVLDEGAWLGPGVVVTNSRYPNRADSKARLEGVRICAGAVVGAGAVLLPGVVIGDHALIGAGAVVVRDVPPGTTIIGNPGRMNP